MCLNMKQGIVSKIVEIKVTRTDKVLYYLHSQSRENFWNDISHFY